MAKIVGTDTFTIPMIKRRGFSPSFAAGIEATASSGGQIMPPIMGAAALVMADLTGAGYLNIIEAELAIGIARQPDQRAAGVAHRHAGRALFDLVDCRPIGGVDRGSCRR
jgi:hypothetical protein